VPRRQSGLVLRVGGLSETCDSYRRNRAGCSRQCRRRGATAVKVAEFARSGCRAGNLALTRRGDPCRVTSTTRWCRPWRFTSFTTKPVLGADFLYRGYLPAPVTVCMVQVLHHCVLTPCASCRLGVPACSLRSMSHPCSPSSRNSFFVFTSPWAFGDITIFGSSASMIATSP